MTELQARLQKALADRYAIEHEIGSGGMATVYLAKDLKHDRQVALKLLRPELGAVLGGERFLREIHIAASLTHPHILGLHDSGEVDGLFYYVMPYVAGESLRQRLERETQLSIEEAIELTRQVAAALDYAHRQGVVHRDIKPENILLQEGQAVVADFGIARALRVAGGERLTETGLSLGTPHYMSPEQASGTQELDGRSDVYSLACVLYEMLVGDPPFTGPTAPAIIARQLVDPMPSLRTVRPTVPEELERAIEKALAKVPADRYDTAGAFVEAAGAAAQVEVVATTERRVPRPRMSPSVWRAGAAVAVVIAIAVVLFTVMMSRPISITTSNAVHVSAEPGLEFQPAISPDGTEVAYVVGPIHTPRLVVQSTIDMGLGQTPVGEEAGGSHWYPTWTRDGASLRFWACGPQSRWSYGDCDWKVGGSRGGPVRSMSVPRSSSRYAWSRDGTRVAFSVGDSIFAYAVDNGERELLGVQVVAPWEPHSLAWSPDGRWIAYVNSNPYWRVSKNVAAASIWILSADGGEPVPVTDEMHMNVSPQWLPDSRHLLFISDQGGQREVYVVEVGTAGPRGEPQKVPGPTDPHSISISADGRSLAYARYPDAQHIWSVPIPEAGVVSIRAAVAVTAGNQVVEKHSLSPDGEWIAFESHRRGELDIYKQRLAGGSPELVGDIPGTAYDPAWSPDGSEIVFHSGTGNADVYLVSVDGGTPERLTDSPGLDINADWSPDGLAIAYQSEGPQGEGSLGIWTVARDSLGGPWGEPIRLTDFSCQGRHGPVWNPDGGSLGCMASGEFVRVSTEGEFLSRLDPSALGFRGRDLDVQFSHDGGRIYVHGTHSDGSEGVWWIPASGGEATKVVALDDPSVTVIPATLTVGREHLYLTVAEYESDIWVMDLEW